jgi:uncharacterized protein
MAQDAFTLITGASSGIGECFARALAPRGRNLVLVARSEEKLQKLAAELRAQHGARVEVIPADLAVRNAASQLVAAFEARACPIDLLINNAGFGARGEFWKLPLEHQSAMIALNINALVELTYLLLPGMIERHRGAIINVSSTVSFMPMPYTTTYAATKAFVTSFSMGLAEELRPYGIPVVTLCPGSTQTNFFIAGKYGVRNLPGGMQAPEAVVAAALDRLARGGGLVVPRFMNKLAVAMPRLLPREIVAKFAAKIFRPPGLNNSL